MDPTGQACAWCAHVVPDTFIYEMVAVGSGDVLRWFRDTFAGPCPARR